MKSKTLILVETPFQLLCAYEYMQTHQDDFCLCLRNSGVGINDQQMATMVAELGLQVAQTFTVKPRDRLAYAQALVAFLAKRLGFYDKVVIGSYFSGVLKVFSNLVLKREVVLLDDGVATLLADQTIRTKSPQKYSAFSIFALDSSTYRHYQCNTFESIAKEYACVENQDYSVFFIGQQLVALGALEMAAYIRVLEAVAVEANGRTVHYVPHRTEKDEFIQQIQSVTGIKILRADVAIEFFMLRNRWYPQKVYSVISTALFSLASIFPKAETTVVCPSTLKTQQFVHYSMVIDAFKQHSAAINFLSVE